MDNEKIDHCHCEGEDCGCEEEKCGCGDDNCGCGDEGCGCGCSDDEQKFVDLEDEDGNIVSCEVVGEFEYKEKGYVLVQNSEDGSTYLFKIKADDSEELEIPDDEEFDEVSAYLDTISEK
ncbi:MAG: DUF1292 domain-containing protein [Clostridiaceae bacterium]